MKNIILILVACFISNYVVGQGLSTTDINGNEKFLSLYAQIDALDDDHCEVPCGIYGDSLRISLIKEHSSTIEKAMKQIRELSKADEVNYNQLIRWVNNKEKHAEEIQHIVSQYFLHQRIKNQASSKKDSTAQKKADKKYRDQLVSLHAILVSAMKCKQNTEYKYVSQLNSAVEAFEDLYFHTHPH